MQKYTDFTNLYKLSKILRFELIPQGKTLDHLEKSGLLQEDEQRAKDYQQVKKIIDDYHKHFIDESLLTCRLNNLQLYYDLYIKKDKTDEDKIEFFKLKGDLRGQLIAAVKLNLKYKNLFKKELIQTDLISWIKTQVRNQPNEVELIEKFGDFTTYFSGFHDNRENMYSEEEKPTSISYRLINENLPKFIENMQVFNKLKASGIDFTEINLLLGDISIDTIFSLAYFNQTLTQVGIDKYNLVLGGKSNEDGSKLRGLNELVNIYNQQQEDKKSRLPKLTQLFKQILSDRGVSSFVLDKFNNDGEVGSAIKHYCESELLALDGALSRIPGLFNQIAEYDLNHIYINQQSLNSVSSKVYGNWNIIIKALEYYYMSEIDKNSNKTKTSLKNKDKWLSQEQFSLKLLDEVLKYSSDNKQIDDKIIKSTLVEYFTELLMIKNNLIKKITSQYNIVEDIIQNIEPETKNLIQQKVKVTEIKNLLDLIMDVLHLCKTFIPKSEQFEKDYLFYSELQYCVDKLKPITALYNQTRNYLTQKPYSLEKYKLNFDNSTLLSGWDKNKETANTSVLLRKDGNYYLGIMNKKHNQIFEKMPDQVNLSPNYEKIVYKLLPGANKMLPKVFLSTKGKAIFHPSPEILDNYANETHKKGNQFNLDHCHKLIDFFKESINKHVDWRHFDFKFSETSSYEDISGFYREVEAQGYKLTFENVSEQYINNLIDDGKLYLFQIYNKDFSPHSSGTPNMHTLYWKALFSEENLANVVYKLSGQAEIFYRKKSINIDKAIKHIANQPINNKNLDNSKKQSTFTYDLIKDRRYTVDKFQFHVPITLNFKAQARDDINLQVKEYIKANLNTHVIGVDRGERNLIYISVINPKGEIVKQLSLNEIVNTNKENTYKVNYHKLLTQKEIERQTAREDWGIIENIKELKEGYLSQVIHKICQLVVEYQAIIVMEDLSSNFKNSRAKVDKQVYQKFEKMLIDKLQYLVFKQPNKEQPGVYNALQLASKFVSFTELEYRKQSGFIFYAQPWNTSEIDPTTGFVNMIKPHYETVEKSKELFSKFDGIKFNQKSNWFEFDVDYSKFTENAEGTKLNWTICTTNTERYSWDKTLNNGNGGQQLFEITKNLKDLFARYKINYSTEENILDQIIMQTEKDFFNTLIKYLSVTLTLHHFNGKSELGKQDYILSPIKNTAGEFFDSRKYSAKDKLPCEAAANGAYHIAKKGLWMINQIKVAEDLRKTKLAISNKEWLAFAQN